MLGYMSWSACGRLPISWRDHYVPKGIERASDDGFSNAMSDARTTGEAATTALP
jgi:hypothetical protein